MATVALSSPVGPGGQGVPRGKSPFTFGRVIGAIAIALALALAWNFLGRVTVTERPHEVKMTAVVIPPPPPPPPPPEPEKIEKPPEPTPAPPIDTPVDTPPPPEPAPTASSDPSPGDDALTARVGAGPSNYGLQQGTGGGTRIGGRPGGNNGFAAYGGLAARELQTAAQRDRDLMRGSYKVRVAVTVDAEGRVTHAQVLDGGDEKRNARLVQMLVGLQLSRKPPPGMPNPLRVDLTATGG